MWGKAGVQLITSNSQKTSGEIIPMAALVTNRVEEGNLAMVTTFCCHDQAKVGPSEALSTLLQWDSPKPSIVVDKIFTNSPYLPWGSFSLPYLDITTLSVGTLAAHLPLAWLCLCRLLSYSSTQVILPFEKDDKELKVYPFFPEAFWESSEEDHHLSDLVLVSVPPSSFPPHQEESSQTEEGPSLIPALMGLQSITQAKAQLKWELAHRMATKHKDQQAMMAKEVDTIFREVFSETSSTNLVRLLPWCISTATNPGMIPICYMSEALATTMQQRVDAPAGTTIPESEGSQTPASTSSPAHPTWTPPLPILSMSDILIINTPPVRCSLARFIIDPQCKMWDNSPNSVPNNLPGKRAHI